MAFSGLVEPWKGVGCPHRQRRRPRQRIDCWVSGGNWVGRGEFVQTERRRRTVVVEFQKKAARCPRGFVRGGGFSLPFEPRALGGQTATLHSHI